MLQLLSLIASLLAGQADAQICCGGYNQSPPYTGLVATRAVIPDGFDTTNRQVMSRSVHIARAVTASPIASLQIIVPNYNVTPAGAEAGQTGTATLQSATVTASLEYPLGTCTQIKFSGVATGTIATNVGQLISDSVTPPFAIPNGAVFAIRMYYVGSAGAIYNGRPDVNFGDAGNIGVSGIADLTVTCAAVPYGSGGVGSNYLPPIAIIGTTQLPSVCLLGASVGSGNGTSFGGILANQATVGYFGPYTQGFSHLGWIDMTRGSITALSTSTNIANRQNLYQYCTNLINELGTNDFFVGESVATTEAAMQTINANFVSKGQAPQTITVLAIAPRTTSTDNWATSVNQTLPSYEANRDTYNNDVRNGTFYTGTFIDLAKAWGTPGPNFGFWKSPATFPGMCPGLSNFYWTGDGIHPTACGNLQAYLLGAINPNWFHR